LRTCRTIRDYVRVEYDLSRLSSRSFEQMVQALAVRQFGPRTVIFGDGPDGGREATVSMIPYTTPYGRNWSGSCIVQAKFRQRPLGATPDGRWALAALEEELTKFARRAGGRERPDYFVFATNVVLGPGVDGAKDRAIAQLEEAKRRWGLRDYDIWDYDKLRAFLDVDHEVRTRFGWITAGDVLASMLQGGSDSQQEFERALAGYLEKALIDNRFVRLEEAGHSSDERTALSTVFVDLPINRDHTDGSGMMLDWLLEQTARECRARDIDPAASLLRLVLVGGPGQGKTTLGQFVCQIFRASLLGGRGEHLTPEGHEAITAVRAACEAAALPFDRHPRFPLMINLTDLAKVLMDRPEPMVRFLRRTVADRSGLSVPDNLFLWWLGRYPLFLVLDGLDEVPRGVGRELVLRCISDFWVDAVQLGMDLVVLATTRPQGYTNDFSPAHHQHVKLVDLSPEQALAYGAKLAAARYGADSERADKVTERLEQAAAEPTTRHLMRSPLQVAIMTVLLARRGRPPQERWSLFHAYYETIYQRECERDTDAADILEKYRPEIDAIHQRVGLALQILTAEEDRAEPRLTGAQLERLIRDRLASEGHDTPELTALTAQIRAAAELRLVFLVGAEHDRIGFDVRSLQEFMAGAALVADGDSRVIPRLRAIAPSPAWRNVLLFAVGECFMTKQNLREHIHTLCRELDVEDSLTGAARSGARIALDLLEDRTARYQPTYHRIIAQHALEVLELADVDVIERLAACHDDSVDDLFRRALPTYAASADCVHATAARRCLVALKEAGVAWAAGVLHSHIPQTAHEAKALLSGLPRSTLERMDQGDLRQSVAQLDLDGFASLDHTFYGAGAPPLRSSTPRVIASIDLGARLQVQVHSFRQRYAGPAEPWTVEIAAGSGPMAVHRACDRFAADPSAQTLAGILADLAQTSQPAAWRECAPFAPWPLAALLWRAASCQQLLAYSELVRAGGHGDPAGWASAEERWARRDATISAGDLTGEHAFPLAVGMVVFEAKRGAGLAWLELLHELLQKVPEHDEQRAALANVVLTGIGLREMLADERPTAAGVAQAVAALDASTHRFGARILDVADPPSPRKPRANTGQAELIAALGENVRLCGPMVDANAQLLRRLLPWAAAVPGARTVEALAFTLASTSAAVRGPIQVGMAADQDGMHGALCEFIALIARHRPADARRQGEVFGALLERDLLTLLMCQRTQAVQEWPEFLAGVHTTAPRRWSTHVVVNQFISQLVAGRSTLLGSPRHWEALGFAWPHPLTLVECAAESG
jgi:hypothetical protein